MDQELTEPGPRKAILGAIETYLDEHYPYWQGDSSKLPKGLAVEMHPLTNHRIMSDPDSHASYPGFDKSWFGKVWILRKISLDLQPGEWRLVVITTEVKIGGRLP